MGTGTTRKTAGDKPKRKGKAQTAADLRKRQPPSIEDLYAAMRTLAVMIDCYERREPQLKPPAGGGIDRKLETALLDVVSTLKGAAELQRDDGNMRSAAVQLRYSFADAFSRVRGKPGAVQMWQATAQGLAAIPLRRRGAPKSRSDLFPPHLRQLEAVLKRRGGKAPMAAESVAARVVNALLAQTPWPKGDHVFLFVVDLLIAIGEFTAQSGALVPVERLATTLTSAMNELENEAKHGGDDPLVAGNALVSELLGVSEATLEKWSRNRRTPRERHQQHEAGEPTAYFGARFDTVEFNSFARRLCRPLGGDRFIRAAALQLGVDDVTRVAVHALDNAIAEQPQGAEVEVVRSATIALVSALGGEPTYFGQVVDGRQLGAGGLYRFHDYDHGHTLMDCARGQWNLPPAE